MEERCLILTVEKARDWYRHGNSEMRSAALSVYTEDELKEEWELIKTFEDACKALNIVTFPYNCSKHIVALNKLDIIRKALNKDYQVNSVKKGSFYPIFSLHENFNNACASVQLGGGYIHKLKIDKEDYYLVCGTSSFDGTVQHYYKLITNNAIYPYAYFGLLNCKSELIANHMGKYFYKEIFDVCYIDNIHYEWIS
jgi:hypothetical protein